MLQQIFSGSNCRSSITDFLFWYVCRLFETLL